MKTYKTEYKVVTDYVVEFEMKINKLALDNWIWCGSMSTVHVEGAGIKYSILMSKTTPVEEDVQQK
jgi:hypothetical protein